MRSIVLLIFFILCFLSCKDQKKLDESRHKIPSDTVALAQPTEIIETNYLPDNKTIENKENKNIEISESITKNTSKSKDKIEVKTTVNTTKVSQPIENRPLETDPKAAADVVIIEVKTPNPNSTVVEPKTDIVEVKKKSIDHTIFQKQLSKFVSNDGKVDYKSWKKDKTSLEQYLNMLSGVTSTEEWTKNEKLAFWINVYNAFTIKLILDHYPVKSIKDVYNGKPWDQKFIQIGDENYALNDIENNIIRKQFNEPRIHFALNCAAKSCPPLVNTAYTKSNVSSLMETSTKAFINSHHNNIQKDRVTISKIFDWYKSDFGNVLDYLGKYSNIKPDPSSKIFYNEYDWSLNE